MAGHPFSYSVSWADVRVAAIYYRQSHGQEERQYHEACDDSTPGMTGTLQPQEAFWVRIKPGSLGLGGFKLLIPAK